LRSSPLAIRYGDLRAALGGQGSSPFSQPSLGWVLVLNRAVGSPTPFTFSSPPPLSSRPYCSVLCFVATCVERVGHIAGACSTLQGESRSSYRRAIFGTRCCCHSVSPCPAGTRSEPVKRSRVCWGFQFGSAPPRPLGSRNALVFMRQCLFSTEGARAARRARMLEQSVRTAACAGHCQ